MILFIQPSIRRTVTADSAPDMEAYTFSSALPPDLPPLGSIAFTKDLG
jgi:hypothetical protein